MKSAMQMKSSAMPQMKLNPSLSPAARRISSQSDFIPLGWDLFRPKGRI